MSKEKKNEKKHCGGKKGAMFAFGGIQLGSGIVSALSLAAISLSFCAVKQEAKAFNDCVEEIRESGKSASAAVRFCNGGN